MAKLHLFIIIVCVQSFYIQLTVCVRYDADILQEEEIERETSPGSIYEVTEKVLINKSSLGVSFGKETRRKRHPINTTAVLHYHTAININGSDISVKNNQIKGAALEFTKNNTTQLCSYFIYHSGFDIDKMPGLWRAVYYKMPGKLGCFQLLIRKTSFEERLENKRKHGDFNKTINWDECHIEVQSSVVKNRNHFLQGGPSDLGVMRNMILRPVDDAVLARAYTLREDPPDQWLMVKDLLLLRGCEVDDIVAFAKATRHISKEDVAEALRELGEELTGHMMCEDPVD